MAQFDQSQVWEDAASPLYDNLVRQFSSDWRKDRATPPDPAGYLPDDPVRRPAALLALLRADLGLRREAGEPARVERYLGRFPELPPDLLVALVYEEYCMRQDAGDAPDARDYEIRFPMIAADLRELLDIHEFVDSTQDLFLADESRPARLLFPRAGETIAGFRLVEELGEGSMARVFLAEERHLANRAVALKVSRKGSREPQTLALLQHTHIVPVHSYHVDVVTKLHLLCMPYFGRATLADILASPRTRSARTGSDLLEVLDLLGTTEPPKPRSEGRDALCGRTFAQAIAWWGARLAEALQYAHDCGVLHHDIKPNNVLVTADATPMLLDFNLAGPPGSDAELGGTLAYMAPEHLKVVSGLSDGGKGHEDCLDGRADIYALGLVLHEALGLPPIWRSAADESVVGRRPADGLREILAARSAPLPRLRTRGSGRRISAAFHVVIRRCLEPDPADRYALAAELAADLQAVADDRPLAFAREPEPSRTLRRAWRNRHVLAGAMGGLVVITAIFAARTAALEREARARVDLSAGIRSAAVGEFAAAAAQFTMAAERAGGGSTEALRTIAKEAIERKDEALAAAHIKARVQAFFLKVEPIRFRLITGHSLKATSQELEVAFAEFKIFGPGPWTRDPELNRLDPPRRERLFEEVNELLYLWVMASDQPGNKEAARKAAAVCKRALSFARPTGPWDALRARYETNDQSPGLGQPQPGDNSDARACFEWGLFAVLDSRPADALAWFEQAVSIRPDQFLYQFALAYHHALYGDAAQAMAHYDAAVALRPQSSWARLNRGQLAWSRQGAWERALIDFEHVRTSPDGLDPELLALELGRVAQRLGDFPSAIRHYDTVIATDGSGELARHARRNRARVTLELGPVGRQQASEEYRRLLRESSGDIEARIGEAQAALRSGRPDIAEADLTFLLTKVDDGTQGLSQRADWLARRALARLLLQRTAEAASDADVAVRIAPSAGRIRTRIRVAIAAGRTLELAGLDPDATDRLPLGGRALRADLNELAEKLRMTVERAGSENAPNAELCTRTRLAILESMIGNHDRALTQADHAVTLNRSAADVWLLRARIRRRAADPEGAFNDAESGLTIAPDDTRLHILHGSLLIDQGKPNAALAAVDRALAAGAGASAYAVKARALRDLGRNHESIAMYTLALREDPEDAGSFLGRAHCLISLSLWDPALADLESAVDCSYDQPAILTRPALAYISCLYQRPNRLSRALGLAARAIMAESNR